MQCAFDHRLNVCRRTTEADRVGARPWFRFAVRRCHAKCFTKSDTASNGSASISRATVLRASLAVLVALATSAVARQTHSADLPGEALSRSAPTAGEERRNHVAILRDNLLNHDAQAANAIVESLREGGYQVTELTAIQACNSQKLTSEAFFLYIIPHCRTYPAAGLKTLREFARSGGHVLFLGGPFLDDPVWLSGGRWLHRTELKRMKRDALPEHRVFADAQMDPATWTRTCNDRQNPGQWKLTADGPEGKRCFGFSTNSLSGWDGYMSPELGLLFGEGHDLFTFLAKGSPQTSQVAIEIQERDGSRWIAVADIDTTWQRIALDVDDFKYWPDAHPRAPRGAGGDRLRPGEARRVGFQLAQSHTTAVAPGEHQFWIADVGTCRNPVAGMQLTAADSAVSFESIFPRYKVFPLSGPMNLQQERAQAIVSDLPQTTVEDLVCAIPRTSGAGFRREQKWRYVPLIAAFDSQGRRRGSPAWLLLNRAAPFSGSVLASLGLNDSGCWSSPTVLRAIDQVAGRLSSGLFLVEAGTEHFACWPHEKIVAGATITNPTGTGLRAELRMAVRDEGQKTVLMQSAELDLAAGESLTWQVPRGFEAGLAGRYHVTTELLVDGDIVDRIEHDLIILDPGSAARDEFLVVNGGDFYLRDEKWYPVGVNYWPLYVSGMDHDDFWAGWLQRRFYDPQLVEQDLERMQTLGINLVSIQSNDPKYYRNLLDFLYRCRRHGIYVNLFCGLASPLAFREEALRDFIETAQLADNSTLMAYDTIWEPGNYVFSESWRPRWDSAWRDWIVEQYGSLAAAEEDWQFPCPRDPQGRAVGPPERYFRDDGPWRSYMAAYRRFMDDLMSRKWNLAHRKLREIDANHLISFRQGNTLPHDFTLTATPKHIDFICPEGYAITNSDDGYWTAGFITRYVQFTTRGKPVVWSEFGQSVWDGETMAPSVDRISAVADYHELFYRMVLETGANGTIPWWWPGGYRVGERSDFGMVNPDGTPRPAADLIRKYATRLTANRQPPKPTVWFQMDRDSHAGGYWHTAFNQGRDAYRKSVADGQWLGIRTAGTDTTSANVSLVAIGNRPATGHNPPKYLNAEFNVLQLLDDSGRWVEADPGATIKVSAGSVKARVSVGNTQEATWLAPANGQSSRGTVALVMTSDTGKTRQWALPASVPYLADADFGEITLIDSVTSATSVTLRMHALDRTSFGEKRTFTLVPADQ